MDKKNTINTAKSFIANGRSLLALDEVLELLKTYQKSHPDYYNTALQLKARYLRANRKESVGLIDDSDAYSLKSVLDVELQVFIEDVDKLVLPRTPFFKSNKFRITAFMALAAALILLTGFFLVNTTFFEDKFKFCKSFSDEAVLKILFLHDGETAWEEEVEKSLKELKLQFPTLLVDGRLERINMDTQRINAIVQKARSCDIEQIILRKDGQLQVLALNPKSPMTTTKLLLPKEGNKFVKIDYSFTMLLDTTFSQTVEQILPIIFSDYAAFFNENTAAIKVLEKIPLDFQAQPEFAAITALTLADIYMETDREVDAAYLYASILDYLPDHYIAKMNYATLQNGQGQHATAIEAFTTLVDQYENDLLPKYARANALLDAGIYTIAEQELIEVNASAMRRTDNRTNVFYTKLINPSELKLKQVRLSIQKNINELKRLSRKADSPLDSINNKLLVEYVKTEKFEEAVATAQAIITPTDSTKMFLLQHKQILNILQDTSVSKLDQIQFTTLQIPEL